MPVTAPDVGGFIGGYLGRQAFNQNLADDKLDHQVKQLAYQEAQKTIAENEEMAAEARKAMAAHADTSPKGTITDEAIQPAIEYSMSLLGHGRPVEAMTVLKGAMESQATEALTRVRVEREQSVKLDNILQEVSMLPPTKEAFQGYWTKMLLEHSDADPKNQLMAQEQLHKISTDKNFNPVLYRQTMVDATMTSLQRSQQAAQEAQARLANNRSRTETYRREEYLPALAQSSRDRAAATVKHYGATATQAKPADIKAASDVILEERIATTQAEKAKVGVVSRDVAERALSLQDSEGLSPAAARKQAYEEQVAKGSLAGLKPAKAGLGSYSKPREVVDTNFIAGNWYIGAKGSQREGQLAFYNGNRFLSAEEMKASSSEPTRAPPPNEDEDLEAADDNESEE